MDEHAKTGAQEPATGEKGGWRETRWSLRYLARNFFQRLWSGFKHRPKLTMLLIFIGPTLVFLERSLLQQYLLVARIYAGAVVVIAIFGFAGWILFRKRSPRWQAVGGLLGIALAMVAVIGGRGIHDYTASYWRYITLEIVDLETLPTTYDERVLPLNSIHSFVSERINETETPTKPDLVKIGNEYKWTLGINQSYFVNRWSRPMYEVIHLSATSSSPELSAKSRDSVNFEIGENLNFSRNVDICTRNAFGLWRFLNYEPGNVLLAKDDAGEWVEIVSLIKWTGLIFPWPEFGGVHVIKQGGPNLLTRIVSGCGKWIPPEKIKDYPFLIGQNIMPYEVSRYMAMSLRFQEGFLAPLPITRHGDIRIADLPEDMNQQPFTIPFRIKGGGEGKLYQYFALEPFDTDKQGLSTSFWVPADGLGPSYAYRHFRRGESPIGVSAVADQVRTSKRNYDWSKNAPVEHRPYIRIMADNTGDLKPRFLWLTTVVTHKRDSEGKKLGGFVAGSVPETAITDAYRSVVVWVDSLRPPKWPSELSEKLGPLWAEKN